MELNRGRVAQSKGRGVGLMRREVWWELGDCGDELSGLGGRGGVEKQCVSVGTALQNIKKLSQFRVK